MADDATLYAQVAELRSHLRIEDNTEDDNLREVLHAACRKIDNYCGWQFYPDTATDTRTYETDHAKILTLPDPISTTVGLVVASDSNGDGTFDLTWTLNTHYELQPLNNRKGGISGYPYHVLHSRQNGGQSWPGVGSGEARVEITATFGWAAIPDTVHFAALLQAAKWHERRESRDGLVAFEAGGGGRVPFGLDSDVRNLLQQYRSPKALI